MAKIVMINTRAALERMRKIHALLERPMTSTEIALAIDINRNGTYGYLDHMLAEGWIVKEKSVRPSIYRAVSGAAIPEPVVERVLSADDLDRKRLKAAAARIRPFREPLVAALFGEAA